jgi:hypothetical protein
MNNRKPININEIVKFHTFPTTLNAHVVIYKYIFWLISHPLYFYTSKPSPYYIPYKPIPRKPPQTPKTPLEKYREKSPKSRNRANPDSKWSILKYCIQKSTKSRKPSKKTIKKISPHRFQKAIHE